MYENEQKIATQSQKCLGSDHFDDHFDEVVEYTDCLQLCYQDLGEALGLSENTLKQCQHEKETKSLKNVLRASTEANMEVLGGGCQCFR